MNRVLFFLITFCILYHFSQRFCEKKTDGFKIQNITSSLAFRSKWETTALTESEQKKLKEDLSQKFYYLASGGQCYAFVSENKEIVIKFFKHHLRRVPYLIEKIPLPEFLDNLRCKHRKKRLSKLERDFNSYKIAYENLKKDTGLIFIHLNKTNSLKQEIVIVDKLNIHHRINLDNYEFVVQKKATLAYLYISDLIEKKDSSRAQNAIDQICHLIVNRCKKGVFDEDPKIHRNVGFIDEEAILIDVGRLKLDPSRSSSSIYKQDLIKITARLKDWLNEKDPQLALYLEQKCND